MPELFNTSEEMQSVFTLGMYWYIFGGIVKRMFSLIHGTESTQHRSGVFGYLVEGSSTEVEDNRVLDQDIRLGSFFTQEISLLQLGHSRWTFQFFISKLSFHTTCFMAVANHQWNHRIFATNT